MARYRDDNIDDVVGQRRNLDPTNGDGSNSREPQMMGDQDTKEQLIKSDCRRYAEIIKETLTLDKHTEFLRVMRNFHKSRIDLAGIKEKVVELFEGHPELLTVFNTYLPNEFKINLPEEVSLRESKKPNQYEVAMNFVNNMKMGLQENYHIYISFLEVLNSYRMGKISALQVHQEVADLLSDHQDLLMEFTTLFPAGYYNAHIQHKDSEKETFGSQAEHIQHVGQPDPDDEGSKQHRSTHGSYVRSLEDTVLNLFTTDMHDRAVCLCKTVKASLLNRDDYPRFLKCIKHYNNENINLQQLQYLVHDLLQDHPNIMKEFIQVINHNDNGKGKRSLHELDLSYCEEINGIGEEMSEENKLEFKYSYMDIHKDFYQLIKQSCSDICSSEQLDKAMKIWTSFVEPMFGLVLRSAGSIDNNFFEFVTNEIDFSPIIDLEKGGFAAFMHDREDDDIVHEEDPSLIFYGNDDFYAFFRLHHALYERLEEARRSENDSYLVFLDFLRNYLNGAYKEKYEDECRTIFGNSSGLIFSIERLINKLSRQLQAIAMDEVDNKLLDLYASSEKTRKSGRFVDEVYATKARMIATAYRMFRFEFLRIRDTDGQTRLTIQQIDLGPDKVKLREKGKLGSRKRRQ